MKETESEILTVMLIDIVGYTKKTSKLSREEFSNLHDVFDNISLPIFDKYAGNVVKKIGDAFLVTFKSVTNSLQCAMEIQNAFTRYRNETGNNLHIRAAIHTGEIMHRHGDIYGDAVNEVARMEGVTPQDQIFFSEAAFSAMNKTEIPFQHLGLKRFRGIKYPVRLFKVKGSGTRYGRKSSGSAFSTFLFALLILAMLCGVAYLTYYLLQFA